MQDELHISSSKLMPWNSGILVAKEGHGGMVEWMKYISHWMSLFRIDLCRAKL